MRLTARHVFALRRIQRVLVPTIALTATVGFGSGCVDTSVPEPISAVAYCEGLAAIDCKVFWVCTEAAAREAQRPTLLASGIDIGTSEATCTANLKAGCAQKPFACGTNETFQESKASSCLDGLQRLACIDLRSSETQPLNCAKVCTSTLTSR
ncbi:MAG: hypothetical protein SF187_25680 [Deltaproteobacteria bacterium]|nr:hypothetical protein [Deltaproteobacteria bacterium]